LLTFWTKVGECDCETHMEGRSTPMPRMHPGCPVMMTENADVENDMANGSQGNIRKVVSKHGHSCHMRKINGMSVKCVCASQVRHVVWDMGGGVVKAIEPRAAGIDCSKFLSVECNVDLSMLFYNIQQHSNATDKYEYDRLVKKFYDYCLDLLPHGYYTTLIENFNYRMYPGELAYELYDLYAKRELLLLRCYNSATHQSNVDVSVRKSLIGKLLELTDGPGFALCITTQSIAIFDRCVSRHQYEKEDVSILMAAAIQLSVAYFHIRHHDMHLPCVELFVGEINVTNEKDVSSNFVGKSVYVRNRLNLFPFFLFMLFRTTIGKWQLLAWRVPSNTIFHPKMLFCQTFRFS